MDQMFQMFPVDPGGPALFLEGPEGSGASQIALEGPRMIWM